MDEKILSGENHQKEQYRKLFDGLDRLFLKDLQAYLHDSVFCETEPHVEDTKFREVLINRAKTFAKTWRLKMPDIKQNV